MRNIHPHIHVIASNGLFAENGEFQQLPEIDKKAASYMQAIFLGSLKKGGGKHKNFKKTHDSGGAGRENWRVKKKGSPIPNSDGLTTDTF